MRVLKPVGESPESLPRDVADEAVPGKRRTLVIGLGTVLVLVGLVLIYNFGLTSLLHSPQLRKYNLTDPWTMEVSSRAVVTDSGLLRWNTMPGFVSPTDIRVEGVAAGSEALFMGIASTDEVARYLEGVAHDEIAEWDASGDGSLEYVAYATNEGAADPAAPGTMEFWVASVSGSGELALDWTIESGEWALVIMNADGSPGVSADVRFGVAALSVLFPIGLATLVVGLVALIGGTRLVTSVPARPDESPRWTLRDRSVLPTTVEGRVAVLCSVFTFTLFTTGTMFGAPIFLFLAVRKGDRSLLLVLPLLVSILPIGLIALAAWQVLVA